MKPPLCTPTMQTVVARHWPLLAEGVTEHLLLHHADETAGQAHRMGHKPYQVPSATVWVREPLPSMMMSQHAFLKRIEMAVKRLTCSACFCASVSQRHLSDGPVSL